MTKKLAILAAVAVAAVTSAITPAFAQYAGDRIDARQNNQARRIDNGLRNGALTPAEAARLAHQQREIAAAERAAKSDGRLTPGERAYLEAKQNQASRNIYAEKHDRQGLHRPWWKRKFAPHFGWGYGRDYPAPRRWY